MKMPSERLIVLEREGHWAAALRRDLDGLGVRVLEVRSWDEVRESLGKWPAALVAAELTEAGAAEFLTAIPHLGRWHPQAAVVVLAERRLAPYRDLLREAGALHFITSPRRLAEVAEIVRRRASKLAAATSTADFLDEIRANLPFSSRSTT